MQKKHHEPYQSQILIVYKKITLHANDTSVIRNFRIQDWFRGW